MNENTAPATKILHVFTNTDDGVQAEVAQVQKGYSVAIKDLDADEYLPACVIYPTLERAVAAARKIL